jgi:hypothetical protein
MWRICFETSTFQLSRGVELSEPFPCSPQTFSSDLIVIISNVADTIYLVHHELLLHTIFFDKVFKHLLSAKRNFHVIDWLDELLSDISFVHILTRANIFSKRIVGSRCNVKHRPHRGKK